MGIIEESIQEYKIHPPTAYISESGKYVDFYNYIHNEFLNSVQPLLNKNGEQFVEYWPCYSIFNLEKHQTGFDVHREEVTGIHGIGVLIMTDKALHLYLYSSFSKKHQPFRGLGDTLVRIFMGKVTYQTRPIKQDMILMDTLANARIQRIRSIYGVDMLPIEIGPRSFYLTEVKAGHDEQIYEYFHTAKQLKR